MLFRAVLAVPPVAILILLSLASAVVAALAWPVALVIGRIPAPFHRALRVYVRYAVRVSAWLTLAARRYPRLRGVVPPLVEVERERHARWSILARPLLVLPSLVLSSALGGVLLAATVAAWVVALALGRVPEGLRELVRFCIRYHAETLAFLGLLTPCAPRLEPPTRAPR